MKLLLSIILFVLIIPISSREHYKELIAYKNEQIKLFESRQYESAITHLKRSEGFKPTAYLCPSLSSTIGYGHKILPNEVYTKITESTADSLLRKDFTLRFNLVKKLHPKLEYTKLLAVTVFVFNTGINKYKKSTLYSLIIKDLPVTTEWSKWVHYRANNKIHTSNNLVTSRRFEISLYHVKITYKNSILSS